ELATRRARAIRTVIGEGRTTLPHSLSWPRWLQTRGWLPVPHGRVPGRDWGILYQGQAAQPGRPCRHGSDTPPPTDWAECRRHRAGETQPYKIWLVSRRHSPTRHSP